MNLWRTTDDEEPQSDLDRGSSGCPLSPSVHMANALGGQSGSCCYRTPGCLGHSLFHDRKRRSRRSSVRGKTVICDRLGHRPRLRIQVSAETSMGKENPLSYIPSPRTLPWPEFLPMGTVERVFMLKMRARRFFHNRRGDNSITFAGARTKRRAVDLGGSPRAYHDVQVYLALRWPRARRLAHTDVMVGCAPSPPAAAGLPVPHWRVRRGSQPELDLP